jgi:hypothetical protein
VRFDGEGWGLSGSPSAQRHRALPVGPLVRFRVEFTAQFTLLKRRHPLEARYDLGSVLICGQSYRKVTMRC